MGWGGVRKTGGSLSVVVGARIAVAARRSLAPRDLHPSAAMRGIRYQPGAICCPHDRVGYGESEPGSWAIFVRAVKAVHDERPLIDRKSTRLNSSHRCTSHAV